MGTAKEEMLQVPGGHAHEPRVADALQAAQVQQAQARGAAHQPRQRLVAQPVLVHAHALRRRLARDGQLLQLRPALALHLVRHTLLQPALICYTSKHINLQTNNPGPYIQVTEMPKNNVMMGGLKFHILARCNFAEAVS